jgi:hypothetical protein
VETGDIRPSFFRIFSQRNALRLLLSIVREVLHLILFFDSFYFSFLKSSHHFIILQSQSVCKKEKKLLHSMDRIFAIQQERLYQWDTFYRLLQALPLQDNAEAVERLQQYLQILDANGDLLQALQTLPQVQTPKDHFQWQQTMVALLQTTLQQEHEAYSNNDRPVKRARYAVSSRSR